MANEPQGNISLLPLILVAALVFFASRGCAPQPVKPEPAKPDQVEVEKDKTKKPTPEECWEALALSVEKKWIGGTMQQHTDHVVKIADGLKLSESVPDTSRVDQWRAKRVDITDANRAEIARQIRGK